LWDISKKNSDLMERLIELWVFAGMTKIPGLMNWTLDTLKAVSDSRRSIPSVKNVAWAFSNSMPGSALRRFFIDCLVWEVSKKSYADFAVELPGEFARELAIATVEALNPLRRSDVSNRPTNPLNDMSNYHVPEDSTGLAT
jgi:hypothetical protein